jgi:hypothetical protein
MYRGSKSILKRLSMDTCKQRLKVHHSHDLFLILYICGMLAEEGIPDISKEYIYGIQNTYRLGKLFFWN